MSDEGIAGAGSDSGGGGGSGGAISGAEALGLDTGSSSQESTPAQESTPDVAAGSQQQQGEPAPTPEQRAYRFADREWPDQGRAENEFRAMVGRVRAEQQRRSELEQMVEVLRSAQGRGSTEDGASGGNGNGQAGKGTPEQDFSQILDPNSLDWTKVEEAFQSGDPALAMYLVTQSMAKQVNERVRGLLDKELGPIKPAFGQVERSGKIYGMLEQASMAVDDQGNLFFPEMSDQGFRAKVISTMREMRESGRFAEGAVESPWGIGFAVRHIRDREASAGNNSAGGAQPPPIHPAAQAAVDAASASASSRGVLPPQRGAQPARQPARSMSEEEGIRQSLLQREPETNWGIPR